MPLSEERVALVSVTYNRGPGSILRHPLMDAIRNGDRAEAWYQLRYECWGTERPAEPGLRKRRFAEAQIFGLYDDPARVSADEARHVYDTYQKHRPEIDRVERAFGVTVDGVESRRNWIAQANLDYPAIVAQYGEVQTISASLLPARTVLLDHLRKAHPQHAADITEQAFNEGRIEPTLLDQRLRNRGQTGAVDQVGGGELLQKLREQVRALDQQAGKPWDDASERLAASALVMAKGSGFTAHDELRLAFNHPTERHAGGEILHLARQGPQASPDPAANRAHMATIDALAVPAEDRLRQVEALDAQWTQLQAERFSQGPEPNVQPRSGPALQM